LVKVAFFLFTVQFFLVFHICLDFLFIQSDCTYAAAAWPKVLASEASLHSLQLSMDMDSWFAFQISYDHWHSDCPSGLSSGGNVL